MRHKHLLSLLAACVAFPALAFPALAHATADCPAAPPKVPGAPITKAIANCAIDHATYLYEHRCTHATNCAAQNAPVTAYYKVASRIYDLYLTTKSMDEGSQSHARTHEHALDTFWSARLLEGAGYYDYALRNYTECQKTVPSKSDNFYTLCSQGVTRLTCLVKPTTHICDQSQSGHVEEIDIVTTTTIGRGVAASIEISTDEPRPENPYPDRPESRTEHSTATVPLPAKEELDEIRSTLTPAQKEALQRAIDEQKITLQPSPK